MRAGRAWSSTSEPVPQLVGGPPTLLRHAGIGCAAPVSGRRIDGAAVQWDCGSTIVDSEACESTSPAGRRKPSGPDGKVNISRLGS